MGKTKDQQIRELNEIYNTPISEGKKDTFNNADPGKHKDLQRYKAIMDNIALGTHTKITIEKCNRQWTFRLLSAEEENMLLRDIANQKKIDGCFEEWHHIFLLCTKVLALALSPSPYKTIGKDENNDDILEANDLKLLPSTVLESLFEEYKHFVEMALTPVEKMSEDEVEALIETIKKKPEELTKLSKTQSLTALHCYRNCLLLLDKTHESEQTN